MDIKRSKVTLQDVADRSGYALRTVKKVMKGENVREKTKADVLLAVKELRYVPPHGIRFLKKGDSCKIAVIYTPISESVYFKDIRRGLEMWLEEHREYNVTLDFLIPQSQRVEAQKQILEEVALRDDIKAVILQPVDSTLLNGQINALVHSGKIVLTLGADAPESERIAYVGPNAYQAGRICCQIMANYLGKKGSIYIISQAHGHMQTIERKYGFVEMMLDTYPDISVYELTIPDDSNLYYELVRSIVVSKKINALFCTDANTNIVGRVVRDLNRDDIIVFGFDRSEETDVLLYDGYIQVILDQKPVEMAYKALDKFVGYLYKQEKMEPVQLTPLYVLTGECLSDKY